MKAEPKQRGLGRGLSALMADVAVDAQPASPDRRELRRIAIDHIEANAEQPRRHFDDEALADLAASIREKGIVQPLVVRPHPEKLGHFQIVAGERRWRAAQLARQHDVPAIVREFDDREVVEVAIIENVQRANLNAIEEAAGYRQLIEKFGHTQERLSEALGKSRSHIANLLRLLNLPDPVQSMIVEGSLSAGHARALITSPDPVGLAHQVVQRGLSVRDTEKLARAAQRDPQPKATRVRQPEKDADTAALEADLAAASGLGVSISHHADGSGSITFRYRSLDQLDDICQKFSN